jgi:hypothetical protein
MHVSPQFYIARGSHHKKILYTLRNRKCIYTGTGYYSYSTALLIPMLSPIQVPVITQSKVAVKSSALDVKRVFLT